MASEQVIIGCKLPNGLIMELIDPPTDAQVDQMNALSRQIATEKEQAKRDALLAQMMALQAAPKRGSRQLLPSPAGKRYTIKGSNSLLVIVPKSPLGPPSQGEHQYAKTSVPEEFATEWFKRNKDLDCVRRGLIFMVKDVKEADGMIKERRNDSQLRTGLEALAEKNDPRIKTKSKRNEVTADTESMAQWETDVA